MKEIRCENCLHNNVCYWQEVTNDIAAHLEEFGCEDYKPITEIKTEVAEIVRCKDCKYWEATDDGISWNNKGRTDGACEMLFSVHYAQRHLTERDHYCGYGKRKTQKEGVGE